MLRSGECNYFAMFSYKHGTVGRELARGENNEAENMGRSSKIKTNQMQAMIENRMLEKMKRVREGLKGKIQRNKKQYKAWRK